MTSIRPAGQEPTPPTPRMGGAKELRVGFNKNTQSFQPLGKADSKKTQHLQQVKQTVESAKRIVPDRTSQAFLSKVKTSNESEGEIIKSETSGVKDFFSGKADKYDQFLKSIRGTRLT